MEVTRQLVEYTETLAKLSLSEEERTRMAGEMKQIIDYMDVLGCIDTTGVEPLSHVFPLQNVFREDVVVPSLAREKLLRNAPVHDEEACLTPKAVE